MLINQIRTKYKNFSTSYGKTKAIYYLLRKVLYHSFLDVYAFFYRRLGSINDNTIVFQSKPDYSDNSRALSDYLVKSGYLDKYKIFWVVNDVDYCQRMFSESKVHFLKLTNRFGEYKLYSLRVIMSAKMLLGTHGTIFPPCKSLKGQKHILLWHGCSFKKKTEDSILSKKDFDYALVAGPLFVSTKSEYWNSDEKYILPLGYPRYDWLRQQISKAEQFSAKIKGNADKIIVWMPTFRDHVKGRYGSYDGEVRFPLIQEEAEWISLDETCQLLNIKLAIKLHMFQKNYNIDFDKLKNIQLISNTEFDKAGISMYNFLAITDGLISDYSSVAVDYMIVDKPIAFILDDFDMYREKRGFVFDDPRIYMPGHHVYHIGDLMKYLEDVSKCNDIYANDRHKLKDTLVHDSTNYCEEISTAIGL